MTHDFPALVRIAKAERSRRAHAWRDLVAQRKVTRQKVDADNLIWAEIEMLVRRYAGDREASRYEYPRSFAALAKSARTTLTRACASISVDDAQGCRMLRDLWQLTRFLEIAAGYSSAIPDQQALEAA